MAVDPTTTTKKLKSRTAAKATPRAKKPKVILPIEADNSDSEGLTVASNNTQLGNDSTYPLCAKVTKYDGVPSVDPNNGRIIPVPRTGKGLRVVIEGETSRSRTRWATIFATSSSLITAHCSLTSRVAAGAVVTLMAFSGRLATTSRRMRLLLGKVTKAAKVKKPNSTPSGKLPLQLPPYLANEVKCVPP